MVRLLSRSYSTTRSVSEWTRNRGTLSDVSLLNRTIALGALVSGIVTFALFMYILLVPIIKGEQPNVRLFTLLSSRCG